MTYTGWDTIAANNNASPPQGAPEGMAASAVNDTIRQLMADLATWRDAVEDGSFFDANGTFFVGGEAATSNFANTAGGVFGPELLGCVFAILLDWCFPEP